MKKHKLLATASLSLVLPAIASVPNASANVRPEVQVESTTPASNPTDHSNGPVLGSNAPVQANFGDGDGDGGGGTDSDGDGNDGDGFGGDGSGGDSLPPPS